LEVFPNPFANHVTVVVWAVDNAPGVVEVFDLNGHLVATPFKGLLHPGNNRFELGSPEPPGLLSFVFA